MKKENDSAVFNLIRQKNSILREKGFTILEVLVAFSILAVVMAGMGMAMTASMRLSSVQKQRALAQDVTREVISSYVKNKGYWTINPFFKEDGTSKVVDITTYKESNPVVQVLYDGTVKPARDYWPEAHLSVLNKSLEAMRKPKLEILYTPIKKVPSGYYNTQVNVVVRLTFSGDKLVEMPTVIGLGDVTRAQRAGLIDPVVPATTGQDCALASQNPTNFSSGICCSGYTLNTGTGLCELDSPTCGGLNLAPVSGACCSGLTLNTGTGLCETATSCGADGQAPVSGVCCSGTALNTGTGLCELVAPTCGTAGQLPVSGTCCSGLFTKPSTGLCTATPACTPLNAPVADNNNASCCSGLNLSAGICILPSCTPNGSTAANLSLCCSSGVTDNNGLAYCGATCLPGGAPTGSKSACCSGDWQGSSPKTCKS